LCPFGFFFELSQYYSAGATTVVVVELGATGSVIVVVRLTVVVVVAEGGGPETVSSLEHAPKEIAAPINKMRWGTVFMTCYYHSSHCYGQLDV
jgi:hypothetical protein